MPCKINKLIEHNKVAAPDFLAQTSAGRCCKNMRAPNFADGPNVGAVVYLRRRNGLPSTVSRKDSHVASANFPTFKIGSC